MTYIPPRFGAWAMADTPALTVREVATLLRVDEKTVYRLAKRKDLPGFKVAGAWRFKRDDIDAWIEKQKASVQ
jgi:excisionase family DNA binding protein